MYESKIRKMEFICYIYSFTWLLNMVMQFRDFYAKTGIVFDLSMIILYVFTFWMGVFASLILPAGFAIVFWSSYRIRNKNERVFDSIGKKVLTFWLAAMIVTLTFQVSILYNAIFFTLVLFIRFLKQEQLDIMIHNN